MNLRRIGIYVTIILTAGLLFTACNKNTNNQDQAASTNVSPTTAASQDTVSPPPTKVPVAATPTMEPEPTDLPPETTPIPSPGELTHSNTVLMDGSYLYYKEGIFKHGNWSSTYQLVAENMELGDKKILTTLTTDELFLNDGFIYYADKSDLYRIRTDGKNKLKLFDGNAANARILGFSGDYLYYYFTMEGQIYRTDIKAVKRNRELLVTNAAEVQLLGNCIYYTERGINGMADLDPIDRLYSIALDGSGKQELYSSYDIYDLITDTNGLYYMDIPTEDAVEAYLCKVSPDNTITKLARINQEELNKKGALLLNNHTLRLHCTAVDTLFYSIEYQALPNTELYSIDTTGDNHMLLMNINDLGKISSDSSLDSVRYDEGYLILDLTPYEAPMETYLVHLSTSQATKLDTGYYLGSSLDILGGDTYLAKASDPVPYGSYGDYLYQKLALSELVH